VLAQLAPEPRGIPVNLATTCNVISEYAHADLVVLPELFMCGYELEDLDELAVDVDGPEIRAIRASAVAAGTAVVIGFAERVAGSGVANSALCVDSNGDVKGVYRKTHLFGDEAGVFLRGDRLEVVDLAGARCGLMICFDVEFPEVARTLALRGADYLVTISANMEPFAHDHDIAAQARAMESGVMHAYVNRVGREAGFDFVGQSMLVDAEGQRVATGGATEQIIECELEPAAVRVDARTRYLDQLRPALYETS
jgi:predicted amidohydrolase